MSNVFDRLQAELKKLDDNMRLTESRHSSKIVTLKDTISERDKTIEALREQIDEFQKEEAHKDKIITALHKKVYEAENRAITAESTLESEKWIKQPKPVVTSRKEFKRPPKRMESTQDTPEASQPLVKQLSAFELIKKRAAENLGPPRSPAERAAVGRKFHEQTGYKFVSVLNEGSSKRTRIHPPVPELVEPLSSPAIADENTQKASTTELTDDATVEKKPKFWIHGMPINSLPSKRSSN